MRDVPNLPFQKPKQIEELEKLSLSQREAMDKTAMKEKIQEVAYSLARTYKTSIGDDSDACFALICTALEELAYTFSGNFGAAIIGYKERAAKEACSEIFG